MNKDDKLSLLIMRDDSPVRRYRFRTAWFRLFLYIQVFLLLAAFGGAYAGITFWGQHLELVNENKALQDNIADKAIRLERLENIQEILNTSDPGEIQALFSAVSKERQVNAPVVNLQEVFHSRDLQMAGVSNLQLSQAGDDLRIQFELNNLSDDTLSGSIRIYFVTQQANVIEAKGDENELSFEIQRFRRVNSLLELPSGMELESIFALRVIIGNEKDDVFFIQTYPVHSILTT
ncbi:hypothetical protein [Desulfonatronum parangueonense]